MKTERFNLLTRSGFKRIAWLCLQLLCVLFATENRADGQVLARKEKQNKGFIYREEVALKVSYFGELVLHPGLSLGIEYSFLKREHLSMHADLDLGGYWHRWNSTALFVKSSIGTRFYVGNVFADLNAGIGYMHAFSAGPIYQRSAAGDVERMSNSGSSHFMPGVSLLFGWDGMRDNKLPYAFHLGPEVYLQSRYNHIYLPHAALNVGFTYKINEQ